MKKQILYTYLGTNGTLTTPIHLENIYSIKKIFLTSDARKILTNGEVKLHSITVPEDEVSQWYEIDDDGQNQLM